MAKNATNAGKKYIIQWNGKRNNWKYKLVIIPSYNDSNYASLTDTTENYSCLLDFEYIPFEFDKYNIGMSAAPSLKLDFNLGLCSANLANVLCDPFTTFDRVTTFNTDSIFPCHELFTTGNVFELYIDFRLEETENYVLQYRGTQITSIEQYDNENKVLTVETESITKTIMGQIKFDNFLFLHCHYTQNGSSQAVPNTTIQEQNDLRYADLVGGNIRTYVKAANTYYFYFDKLEKVYEGMEYLCSLLFKKIMRKSSYETFTINRLWSDFYKINQTTGARGSVLLDSEKYIVAHINTFALSTQNNFDNIGSADGFIYGLGNEYESMWDFFADLAGSYCQKSIGGTQNLYVGQMLNTVEKIVDLKQIHDCKITFFADVASKFSISASEDHEGKSDTVEVNIIGTRSSEAVEFQQPLHNVPFIGEYRAHVETDGSDIITCYTTAKCPNLCLSYYDGSTNFYAVHPRNKIDLGNSIDSDSYNTVETNMNLTIPIFCDYGVNSVVLLSDKYGSYYVSAQTMSYFFSHNYQTKIECKVFAEYLQDEVLGTAYSPFLLPTLNRFTIDLSTLEPATGVFSEIPTKYEIISSKFTKENEMCEIVLLSRRV